jgi:hypothetical protein
MNVQIIVTLSETTYQALQEMAAQHGQSLEDYLVTLIEQVVAKHKLSTQEGLLDEAVASDPATDPLAPFAGAFHFTEPDLASNHHTYLAEAYADNHDDEPDE